MIGRLQRCFWFQPAETPWGTSFAAKHTDFSCLDTACCAVFPFLLQQRRYLHTAHPRKPLDLHYSPNTYTTKTRPVLPARLFVLCGFSFLLLHIICAYSRENFGTTLKHFSSTRGNGIISALAAVAAGAFLLLASRVAIGDVKGRGGDSGGGGGGGGEGDRNGGVPPAAARAARRTSSYSRRRGTRMLGEETRAQSASDFCRYRYFFSIMVRSVNLCY